jgi:hypothetical protein
LEGELFMAKKVMGPRWGFDPDDRAGSPGLTSRAAAFYVDQATGKSRSVSAARAIIGGLILLGLLVASALTFLTYRQHRITAVSCPAGTAEVVDGLVQPGVTGSWCQLFRNGQAVRHGPFKSWVTTYLGTPDYPLEQGSYRDGGRDGTWTIYRSLDLKQSFTGRDRPSEEIRYESGRAVSARFCDERLPWWRTRCRAFGNYSGDEAP